MTEPHMLARASDPDTSKDAAAIAALSPTSGAIKGAIMRALRKHGPRTAFELRELYLADGIGPACQPNTINRRVSDLANMGFVHDTGQRRKTPDGRQAIVWRALTRTERTALLANYGLRAFDVEVETDWSKVSDVRRLRQRIAELEARLRAAERG
jgi:DNA-binding HxlR family transcriptional regulator